MMTEREIKIYDLLIDFEIATDEELMLVRYVMSGDWEEILNAVIYARTGYRSIEQLLECEFGDDYALELLRELEDIA